MSSTVKLLKLVGVMEKIKILGAGLMCIDVVHNQKQTTIMNGGSCANVISVLSQIGFDSSIIRERYSDQFEAILSKTLASLGVKEIIYKRTAAKTPRIIEILENNGHDFFTCCPNCGEKILKLPLPTERDLGCLDIDFSEFDYFYCDRSSPGIRKIMDIIREHHGLVVYEPNTARNIDSLLKSASHADIVKFSSDRVFPSIAERIRTTVKGLKLLISTQGQEGLRFSHIQENGEMSDWVHLPSEFCGPVIDSSGAGDWLTAGFISELIKSNLSVSIDQFYDQKQISNMLTQGMKYSHLCCAAVGAQGVFYSEQSIGAFNKLNNYNNLTSSVLGNEDFSTDGLCPLCLSKIS